MKKGTEKGMEAARYFGQEAECRRVGIEDYREDIASYFGYENWESIPSNVKADAMKEFSLGREFERNAY